MLFETDAEAQLLDKVKVMFRSNVSSSLRELNRQILKRLDIAGGECRVVISFFKEIMMQLNNVCNRPSLFYSKDSLISSSSDYLIRADGKFELLNRILHELQSTADRVLIFLRERLLSMSI